MSAAGLRGRTVRGPAVCLTAREVEILQAVVDNAGTEGAAFALGVAEGHVKNSLATMRSKCGVQTTYQLTLVAARRLRHPPITSQKAP